MLNSSDCVRAFSAVTCRCLKYPDTSTHATDASESDATNIVMIRLAL
jgi:hypothetical protein